MPNENRLTLWEWLETLDALTGAAYWSAFLAGGMTWAAREGPNMREMAVSSFREVGIDPDKEFAKCPGELPLANTLAKAAASFFKKLAAYLEAQS